MTDTHSDLVSEYADLWAQWHGFGSSLDLKKWAEQHELQRSIETDAEKDLDE